jgi:hypothetical protein
MPQDFFLSLKFLPFALVIWTGAIITYFLNHKQWKFSHYGFSIKKYHLMVSVLLLYPLWWTFRHQSFKLLILFLIFAVCGILVETFASTWWRIFYPHRFYVYAVEALDHNYTSLLNIIPWGAGGFLYLTVVYYLAPLLARAQPEIIKIGSGSVAITLPFYFIFLAATLAFLALDIMIWNVFFLYKNHHYKFKTVTLINYLFVFLPFAGTIAVCAFLYGPIMLELGLAFGVLGALAEYLFGKACQFFISKKLWAYNYLAFDNGHLTPLTLLPFAFLGFCFWAIGLVFQTFYR